MSIRCLSTSAVALLITIANPVYGQAADEPASSTQPESVSGAEFHLAPSDSLAARIDALIARLGVRSYREREDATKALIELGPSAYEALRAVYHVSDELEVRLRIERIIHTSYFAYHLYDRNGFLGISHSRIPRLHEDDSRIPEGQFGVLVKDVMENTGAAEAGVRKDDVIIALNGEGLEGGGVRATAMFGESVRVLGPGTAVRLTILRGPDRLEIVVTLRSRPKKYYGPNQGVVYEMLRETERAFRFWWDEHFLRAPAGEPAPSVGQFP
jgi:S1-C subfamily serine protease